MNNTPEHTSAQGITLVYGAELIVKICSHVNGFSHGAKLYVKTCSHGAKLYVKTHSHGAKLYVKNNSHIC